MTTSPTLLDLTEYVEKSFAPECISQEAAHNLYQNYKGRIEIEWPSPKTGNQWTLESKGWVGHIPVNESVTLVIKPKVELGNLFRMLEYAYNLKSFHFLKGQVQCQSLEEFYERLAHVLAKLIADRSRKGLYRSYIPHAEQLSYIRGRLDLNHAMRTPWAVNRECRYEEHTADVEENQLLLWTLWGILRSGICTERVMPTIRHAYRSVQGFARLSPFHPQECINRTYNRLNQDYHPLHALCHFFLEHTGPSHQVGDRVMLPFLVNMARLYEQFVAEWLKVQLPPHLSLKIQEKAVIEENHKLHANIDLVLTNSQTGKTCVLDTKYKAPTSPTTNDLGQIYLYSGLKESHHAILIYPIPFQFESIVRGVPIRCMTFALEGDLEQAGQAFLLKLLAFMED